MILPLSVLVPTVAALGVVLLGIWYSLYLVIFRPRFRRNREGLVLITGTSSGIGRDAAVALAKAGYVVAAGVRKESDAQATRELGLPNLLPVIIDVADQASVDRAVVRVADMLRVKSLRFAGLVNNAGIVSSAPLEYHDINEVKRIYDVNVFGVMHTTAKFLPLLRQHQGRVITMGSMCGYLSLPMYMGYSSSKWAIEGMTDSLRVELEPLGVAVCNVIPGVVRSGLHGKDVNSTPEEGKQVYHHLFTQMREKATERALERAGTSESTVAAILHAMRDDRPYPRYYTGVADGMSHWFIRNYMTITPTRLADLFNEARFVPMSALLSPLRYCPPAPRAPSTMPANGAMAID